MEAVLDLLARLVELLREEVVREAPRRAELLRVVVLRAELVVVALANFFWASSKSRASALPRRPLWRRAFDRNPRKSL